MPKPTCPKEREIERLSKLLRVALQSPNNYRGKFASQRKKARESEEDAIYWKTRFREEVTKNRKLMEKYNVNR
jgi:hypothetical protein